jgi:hypothetical protein
MFIFCYVLLHITKNNFTVNRTQCSVCWKIPLDVSQTPQHVFSTTAQTLEKDMSPKIENIPWSPYEERQIADQIKAQKDRVMAEITRLVELETTLSLRRHAGGSDISSFINPLHRRRISGAQLILAALDDAGRENRLVPGLRLADIERRLEQAGHPMTPASISATLGRLKREGKIERQAGRWLSLRIRLSDNHQ